MSASNALASPLVPGGNAPRRFVPRRGLRHRIPRNVTAAPAATDRVSLLSIGLVTAVALTLALLACTFIVTGLAVWVANGAAEWVAAAVPALLAVLLFGFALQMARLLQPRSR